MVILYRPPPMTSISQTLSEQQQQQEDEYLLPYHWFWKPETESGRAYFCYLKMVAERMPKLAHTLIDIGCGDGRATTYLKSQHPAMNVIGTDYSAKALALARVMSNNTQIIWEQMDLRHPHETRLGSANCVTAIEVLEHIPPEQLPDVVRGVFNILADTGRFIITVPTTQTPPPRKHYQHFTQESITNVLEKAGFRIERIDGQERSKHWLLFIYKFFDNRWWSIKPAVRWFNTTLYPNYISTCNPSDANRFVIVAVK